MKALIIAEKPSVAKDIAKALNVPPIAGAGHWENDQLVISNAVGHLVQLAAPPAIANLLPVIPEKFELEALPKTQAQLRIPSGFGPAAELVMPSQQPASPGQNYFLRRF